MTYNHEPFIRDSIESILMQKTNFLVEVVVGDDFSTDNTLNILREYENTENVHIKILERKEGDAYWKERQKKGRLFNFFNIIQNCGGQYIAMLDGDDYWTDSLKLQKQVDFLEANNNCVLCFHYQSIRYEKNAGVYYGELLGENQRPLTSVKDLFEWKVRIEPRTVLFKNVFREVDIPDWFLKVDYGDISLNFILGKHGHFGFLNENMAVYRITGGGYSLKGRSEQSLREWKVDHNYKWLNIWLHANSFYNRTHRVSAIKGYKFFLKTAVENEGFIKAFFRQLIFMTRNNNRDFKILYYSLRYIYRVFMKRFIFRLKNILKGIIGITGFEIRKKPRSTVPKLPHSIEKGTMGFALSRLKNLGINPSTIIDVGAASGSWTKQAIMHWPKATYHLIEPLEEQFGRLQKLQEKYKGIKIHAGVAGEVKNKVNFSVTGDLDGSGVYGDNAENVRQVDVYPIDELVGSQGTNFLIKLDTHGYEIPILKGASGTLKKTDALIIEVYGFYVSPTAILFHEISDYLMKIGFRLYDIVDVMRREKDQAFWQADAVYLKSDHPVFSDNRYI